MTRFQSEPVDTARGRIMSAAKLFGRATPLQAPAPAGPDNHNADGILSTGDPASPPEPVIGRDPFAVIIGQLLPHAPSTEREQLGLRLAEQTATRLAWHWRQLLDHRPALQPLAVEAPDFGLALRDLAPSLTWPAALTLLAGGHAEQTMIALESPVAAVRESALDAMVSISPLLRFDQACEAVCRAHLAWVLERLPPDDRETSRSALDDDGAPIRPVEPIAAPTHESATEPALLLALRSGDNRYAVRLLAAAALVPTESIETAISLRSRRGLVSLAWKAGFSMRAAVLLQTELASIPVSAALTATADGSCPLNRSEMVWQIGFLARKLM